MILVTWRTPQFTYGESHRVTPCVPRGARSFFFFPPREASKPGFYQNPPILKRWLLCQKFFKNHVSPIRNFRGPPRALSAALPGRCQLLSCPAPPALRKPPPVAPGPGSPLAHPPPPQQPLRTPTISCVQNSLKHPQLNLFPQTQTGLHSGAFQSALAATLGRVTTSI